MPLRRFAEHQLALIHGFLADPRLVLLELHALPEQQVLIRKLLQGIAADAEGVFVGVEGTFTNAVALCDGLAAALEEALDQAKPIFEEDGMALDVPGSLQPAEWFGDAAPEARVISFGERIARELFPVFEYVAVVVQLESSADAPALLACLARLCVAAQGGRLKLIIVTDQSAPLVPKAPLPRPRLLEFRREHEGAAQRLAEMLLHDPLRRVFFRVADARGQEQVADELTPLRASARHVFAHVRFVRFWSAGHYYGRALRQVVHSCQQLAARRGLPADRFGPFVADVEFPHVQPAAEAFFVARLERLVEDCFPSETLLVVLLTPEVGDGAHELEALNESIVRLSRAAVTPRVKFVVAAHPLDVPAPREELCVATSDVRVDASVIEQGIRERLRMPEVPLVERLRLTMALSSFALARDEPEVALPLGLEAFQLAQETGSAEEVLLTRYALAGHLYRCGALDQASEAYADVLASAIDQDNRVLAAQALVGLGHCHFMLRQYDRAIHSYGVARTYFAKLGQHVSEAYAITWRAESLAHMNDLTQAEHDFHEALLACGRAGQGAESSRADILLRLGELYQRQRRTSEAHRYTEAARASGAVAPPSHEP